DPDGDPLRRWAGGRDRDRLPAGFALPALVRAVSLGGLGVTSPVAGACQVARAKDAGSSNIREYWDDRGRRIAPPGAFQRHQGRCAKASLVAAGGTDPEPPAAAAADALDTGVDQDDECSRFC